MTIPQSLLDQVLSTDTEVLLDESEDFSASLEMTPNIFRCLYLTITWQKILHIAQSATMQKHFVYTVFSLWALRIRQAVDRQWQAT